MTALRTDSVRRIAPIFVAFALGCGGTTTAVNPDDSTSASSHISSGSIGSDTIDPRRERELDPLRPAPVRPTLDALDRNPDDTEAYARGAIAYADTDVAGMTLVWGQTYRVLDPHGRKTVDVANAMSRVLREKVTFTAPSDVVLHFAPGAMPVLPASGHRYFAPFAHLYEHSMNGIGNAAALGLSTYEGQSAVFAVQSQLVCRDGAAVLEEEFYTLLCGLATEGHRDAYAHWVIGPAFSTEWETWKGAHEPAVEAMQRYLAAHPFRPQHATRPDDLHPVRPPNR